MKKFLCFFIALFLTGSAFANPPTTQELPPLIVGTTSGYAPFVSLNGKGDYEGFDIDMAEKLAQKLSRKVVIKDCGHMPGLMLALKQGKVDVLLWAISMTEERMKTMDMIYYQGEKVTEMPILFWKTIPKEILSLNDLSKDPKGAICVEAGSFQEGVLKTVPSIVLKYTDKIDDVLMELKYGKSTAGAMDASLLPRFLEKYPELQVLNLKLPENQQSLGHGVCIHKQRSELSAQIQQAIEQLREEGVIGELEKKWNLQ